jgi:hypothetical protein
MTISYNPTVALNGMFAYIDAANIKSYPLSGLNWYDISKNNNNFTLSSNGGVVYDAANNGVMSFNGVNGAVTSNTVLSVSTSTVTAMAWVKVDAHGNFHNFINNHWTNNGWLIYTNVTSWVFGVSQASVQNNVFVAHNNSTAWTHLAGTYDGANVKLYVNGIVGTPVALASATLDVGFQIAVGGGTRPSPYKISQSVVYNRALLADEVSQNFNATRGRYGI